MFRFTVLGHVHRWLEIIKNLREARASTYRSVFFRYSSVVLNWFRWKSSMEVQEKGAMKGRATQLDHDSMNLLYLLFPMGTGY